jgi:hypothetical protein
MANEKEFWVEANIDEMPQLLKLIREEHLKMTPMQLSRAIYIKVDTIEKSEKGATSHAHTVLKKTCEKFGLKYDILISKT